MFFFVLLWGNAAAGHKKLRAVIAAGGCVGGRMWRGVRGGMRARPVRRNAPARPSPRREASGAAAVRGGGRRRHLRRLLSIRPETRGAQSCVRAGLLTCSTACAFPTDGSVASCTAVPPTGRNSQQRVLFRHRTGFPFNPVPAGGGSNIAKVYLFCGISIFFYPSAVAAVRAGCARHGAGRAAAGSFARFWGRKGGRFE